MDSWFEKISSANAAIRDFNGNLANVNGSVIQAQVAANDAQQRAAESEAFITAQTNSFYANLNRSMHDAARVGSQLTSQASDAVAQLAAFNSSLHSQLQSMQSTYRAVTDFVPDLLTSNPGAPDVAWNSRTGQYLRIGSFVSYSFRLSGTCNSNYGGAIQVSVPGPNASDVYQSGSASICSSSTTSIITPESHT